MEVKDLSAKDQRRHDDGVSGELLRYALADEFTIQKELNSPLAVFRRGGHDDMMPAVRLYRGIGSNAIVDVDAGDQAIRAFAFGTFQRQDKTTSAISDNVAAAAL